MIKTLDIVYEEIPTKVPEHYRLDGRTTGIEHRKVCGLLFPIGFPKYQAQKMIRRKMGFLPLDWDSR